MEIFINSVNEKFHSEKSLKRGHTVDTVDTVDIQLYNCGASKKRARCMFSYHCDVGEEYHSNLLYRYYTVDTIDTVTHETNSRLR